MNRSKEFEDWSRAQWDGRPTVDIPPKHALRGWHFWLWLAVVIFLMCCTIKGY
jgi:hypothetical protein